MTNKYLFKLYILVIVLAGFSLVNCDKKQENPDCPQLAVPANVKVEVVGRVMTVSWDAVANAIGYQIYTTSTGCGSGNRIVNTATQTATTHSNAAVTSVVFIDDTSFRITLMASSSNPNAPMASAVSAKVMALADGEKYSDSDYSKEKKTEKAAYLPAE
jgi:hypothetical protein